MKDKRAVVQEFIQKKFLGPSPLQGDDQPLFSSGAIDSFGVLELIAFLEITFHVLIDTQRHELRDFDTVNSIMKVVERLSHAQSTHP